jgi:hypothetical protein
VADRRRVRESAAMSELPDITEPRLWRKNGWIAKVIKNEDEIGRAHV